MTACAAVTLYLEARTEPYHIDELRQVRPYGQSIRTIVDAAFAQEQPPLDPLVGGFVQRLLGIGDIIQRLHSIGAALGVLVLLAVLLWRAGLRVGVPVVVGTLAIAPAFISFSAYARPYALPLFLMLGFAVGTELWLEDRNYLGAAVLSICALLLPLSRVFEPPAFLVLASAAAWWFARSRPEWGRRVWWVIGSAAVALLFVEIPVYAKLSARLNAYRGDEPASFADQWDRVRNDSLPRLADVFEHGWIALALVAIVFVRRETRQVMARLWWFWPLTGTALAFAIVFHIRTQPSQPFFGRYGYYWWPPFAVCLAVLVNVLADRWNSRSVLHWLVALTATAYFGSLTIAIRNDFTTTSQGDYRTLGEAIESRLALTTSIVFDTTSAPLGSYRPGYAGYGRYTSYDRIVLKAETLIRQPGLATPIGDYAIANYGAPLDVDGWTAIAATDTMTLYLPRSPRSGLDQLAVDMIAFGRAIDPRRGAVLRLGGVSMLHETGNLQQACRELADLVDEDPDQTAAIETALGGGPILNKLASCPGGNPLDR